MVTSITLSDKSSCLSSKWLSGSRNKRYPARLFRYSSGFSGYKHPWKNLYWRWDQRKYSHFTLYEKGYRKIIVVTMEEKVCSVMSKVFRIIKKNLVGLPFWAVQRESLNCFILLLSFLPRSLRISSRRWQAPRCRRRRISFASRGRIYMADAPLHISVSLRFHTSGLECIARPAKLARTNRKAAVRFAAM